MSRWLHRYERGRSTRVELMDQPDASPTELDAAYAELERLNRWLGGHASSLYGIELVAGARRREGDLLRVLDVGAGGGELAPVLAAWGARRGRSIDYTGLDDDRAAAEYARRHHGTDRARFVCEDLFEHEPVEPYDVVHMGITLHHFDGDAAVRALRQMAELVRPDDGGVVINDLQRHPVPFYAVQLVTAALRSPAYVRHDAPLSVNRAFTRDELVELAKAAGWTRIQVSWRPMFRWVLTGR